MLQVTERIQIPDDELRLNYTRSSGPGGQNVNKVSSRAVLTWSFEQSTSLPEDVRVRFETRYRSRISNEGTVQISSQRYRDQIRNAEDCRTKLVEMIVAVSVAPTPRKATKPGRGAHQRRLKEKKVRSDRKQGRGRVRSGDSD